MKSGHYTYLTSIVRVYAQNSDECANNSIYILLRKSEVSRWDSVEWGVDVYI